MQQMQQMQQLQDLSMPLDLELHGEPLINVSMASATSASLNFADMVNHGTVPAGAPAFLPIHIPTSHVVTLPWSHQMIMPAVNANDFAAS